MSTQKQSSLVRVLSVIARVFGHRPASQPAARAYNAGVWVTYRPSTPRITREDLPFLADDSTIEHITTVASEPAVADQVTEPAAVVLELGDASAFMLPARIAATARLNTEKAGRWHRVGEEAPDHALACRCQPASPPEQRDPAAALHRKERSPASRPDPLRGVTSVPSQPGEGSRFCCLRPTNQI